MTNPYQKETFFSDNKSVIIISIVLLLCTAVLFFYSWFTGINQVISWQILSELGNTQAIIDRFQIAGQAFEIPAKVYYVTEQYVASGMQVNELASYVWLSIFILALSFIAAGVCRLANYWYYGAMAGMILLMASLSLDAPFGVSNYIYSSIILAAFIGISYFFFAFKTNVSLTARFFVFLLFFIIVGFAIYFFSKDLKPFMYLAAQSVNIALVLVSLFAFVISYEIVLAILTVSTKGGGSKSLLNFAIGTFIYLINISLTYLHNINYLDWDILYFSPYLLLTISIALGFFSLQKKALVFKNIIPQSSLIVLYIGFSMLALGFVAYAFSTGNDPLLEAIEDATIYSHLVMGALFFSYVFLNFFDLFRQHKDVSKVVFKPLLYPIIYFRAGAALVFFAMLVNNNFFPAMQGFAGYYNARGDYSVATGEYKLAEAYYKTAIGYERQNHKSNYALASLAAVQGDNPTAGTYFRLAVQKKPTEYAFAALSNSLQKEDLFFEAMFALKDGLKVFPKSGELQNNLALLFEKSKVPDSTLKYLELAKLNAKKSEIPETNILSFWIKNGDLEQEKLVLENANKGNYNGLNANTLALRLILDQKVEQNNKYIFDGDSTLNMANFAWLYNASVSNNKKGDFTNAPFHKLIEKEGNFNLANDLQMANIYNEYYAGSKLKALDLLEAITVGDTSETGHFNQVLLNTLLKKTLELPSQTNGNLINNINDAQKALLIDPLSEKILSKALIIMNKAHKEKLGYEAVLNAMRWRKNDPNLQKMYILQCFKIHMNSYAADGLMALKSMNLAEYNSFLPVYQAQMSLVEKQAEDFN